jgi:hypothetical protein
VHRLEHEVQHWDADESRGKRDEGNYQCDPEDEEDQRGALVVGVEERHAQD